jgi:membrane-associated phospholipid phosphatase
VDVDRREDHAPSSASEAFLSRHARAALWLAAGLIVAVALAWVVSKATSLLPHVTPHSISAAYRAHHGPLRDISLAIARFGDAGVALVTVAAISAYCWVHAGIRAAVLPWAAGAVVVFTTIAKNLPGRETSLPSGHAAYATAIAGLAAWLFLRAGRPWWAGGVFLLGLAMAPARVIEGAHVWPDVVAGVALGIGWLLGVLVLVRAWALRPRVAG